MALKAEALFEKMVPLLETHGEEFVKKVGAVFHFEIKANKDSEAKHFSLDLKNGKGKFSKGKEGTADATFSMLDDTIIAL